MLEWLVANIATIVISFVIVCILAAVIVYLRREKKKGHSCGCGCNCGGCNACGEHAGK